jgi:hypothetical protein
MAELMLLPYAKYQRASLWASRDHAEREAIVGSRENGI